MSDEEVKYADHKLSPSDDQVRYWALNASINTQRLAVSQGPLEDQILIRAQRYLEFLEA